MAAMGTTQMLSMRMAAEYPASISEPKLFTTDCTSIMPMETVDCCRMEGRAMRAMRRSSALSKQTPPSPAVLDIIAEKAPLSAAMGLGSMAIALALGLPLGIAMAKSKSRLGTGRRFLDKFWDKFGTAFIVFITAVPSAVYYLFIQLFFTDPSFLGLPMLFSESNPASWILPTLSLSLGNIAYYAMWLRRYMVDELNKDYIQLARAKGLPRTEYAHG